MLEGHSQKEGQKKIAHQRRAKGLPGTDSVKLKSSKGRKKNSDF